MILAIILTGIAVLAFVGLNAYLSFLDIKDEMDDIMRAGKFKTSDMSYSKKCYGQCHACFQASFQSFAC